MTEFINGDGLIFFSKQSRARKTNVYDLNDWVLEFFKFFECKGMMKGFLEDFESWKKTFLKRVKTWLLPQLEKGHSLKGLFMNKLSTENRLKGAKQNPLKGASIKPSGDKAFQGYKSNTELPGIDSFQKIGVSLKTIGLKEGDISGFMKNYSLNHQSRALQLWELWKKRGMSPNSPVKVYQKCLNETRKVKYANN